MDFIEKTNVAFHPASEIKDPAYFVGRRDEIKNAIYSLREDSTFLVIWGNRGIGKSSLSRQVALIAEGKSDLPKFLGFENLLPKGNFNFLAHFVFCDRFTRNVEDLIKRIVYGDQHTEPLFKLTKDEGRCQTSYERTIRAKAGANLGPVNFGAGGEEKVKYETKLQDDVIQTFKTLIGSIKSQQHGKQGLLILIDEFDVLADKSGFSSLIKSCSDEYVKFCVAGISSDIKALLGDHASITRQIKGINVKKMNDYEMGEIITRAEKELKPYVFDEQLKTEIIRMSEGFPYFVHLLGKSCAINAFECGNNNISLGNLKNILEALKNGSLSAIYEQLYQVGVKHSPQREILLKAFADSSDEEICSTDVYELAKSLGVSNPSQLMKELTSPEGFEPILYGIRERYYRFNDPVFRTYVKLRNWKFND